MKKLRNLLALIAVAGMAAFMTGCDDDNGGDNDDNGNQQQGPQFAPADAAAFRAQTYTITDPATGQAATLRFPAEGQYEYTPAGGAAETGTYTATPNGEVWTVTAQSAGGQTKTFALTFTANNNNNRAGSYVITADGQTQSGNFTSVPDTGGTTAGTTAGETAGETAGTTAGETAGTTAGETAGTTAGETAGTTAGETAGTTAGETAGTTSGTGTIPTTLSGKAIQLTYTGGGGQRWSFSSDSAGTYEDGTPATYTWDSGARIVRITDNSGLNEVTLTFSDNTYSAGTFVTVFTAPGSAPQTYDGTFTLQ